jgi:hypothetical protein
MFRASETRLSDTGCHGKSDITPWTDFETDITP